MSLTFTGRVVFVRSDRLAAAVADRSKLVMVHYMDGQLLILHAGDTKALNVSVWVEYAEQMVHDVFFGDEPLVLWEEIRHTPEQRANAPYGTYWRRTPDRVG